MSDAGADKTPQRRRAAARPDRAQALADARGGALEGLDWLQRTPESKASLFYRATRLLARAILVGAFRFRIETSGQEHLPKGGYFLVAAAHRGWMDPFVVLHAIPAEPRAWFLGSGPSTFTSRWREVLIRRARAGCCRSGAAASASTATSRRAGGRRERRRVRPDARGTVSGPPGRIGPFRNGWALIALRVGAPIVPIAMAGTEELYIGKRMASRDPGGDVGGGPPRPGVGQGRAGAGSRAELDLAKAMSEALAARLGPSSRSSSR
jgi:1-acyl-sn-glycerol-3-phosphate acyltransferase